jgi:hypothetical protein
MNADLQAQPDLVEPLTGPLPLRVLVTAQAFGFGPAAAMAQVFDHLRPRVRYLAFAGAGHTCDVHMDLPYDAVHRLPDLGTAEAFGRLCAGHDAALVSCDVPAGEAARAAGVPFGFYDPIPWFWPEWPSVFESADVYMGFQAHREPATPNPLHALLDRFGAGGDRHVAEIFVKRVLTPLALSGRDRSKGTAR